MIRSLTGTVSNTDLNKVVIEVGGLGYLVFTNSSLQVGDEVTLHSHLAVRENALDLYGFLEYEELMIFELLLDLPKIGPKSALQIMNQADVAILREATANQDSSYLTKMSGIGKKTAEKIVLGLKDKLENVEMSSRDNKGPVPNNQASDIIDALITLGYSPNDAREVVIIVGNTHPELTAPNEILKAALRQLN